MAEDRSPSPTDPSDYDSIERAVAETERGRWFLNEFSRRNRAADTRLLLDAIARLERAVSRDRPLPETGELQVGIAEIGELIAETRSRISAAPFDSLDRPGRDPMAVVVRTSDRIASSLASTAEHIHDVASALRDHGVRPELCNAVDRHATAVTTAATIQELAAQRIAAVVEALLRIEARVDALTGRQVEQDRDGGIAPGRPPHLTLLANPDFPA